MIRKKYDKIFLSIVLALLFFGFLILFSASLGLAARENKDFYIPLIKQLLLGGGVGFILFAITSKIHYKNWQKLALPIFLGSLILTFVVFEKHFGLEYGGARRWISLGALSFQPAELLKFSCVLYLSSWLSRRQKEVSSLKKGLLPFLIIVGLVAIAFVLQPDIGTLGVICATAAFLFFLAGGKYKHIGLIVVLGLIMLASLTFFKPYMMSRINVFFNASYDPLGAGYQINQSKIAMGSGGIFGRGFGHGVSKFNYLPEPTGDSIFAVIGEEFGFIGAMFLILLFLAFLYRALHISTRAPDMFGRLLCAGIAILITVQSFVNMYAVVGLIPLTGLPLIFISQGGSALAFAMAEVGIILNISK